MTASSHHRRDDKEKIILSNPTSRVFISYRNIYPSNVEAERLAIRLREIGFDEQNLFFDQTRLKAGDIWAQEIFNNIRRSDVLIVLLQADRQGTDSTAKSEWVQREVDVARGANVSILPIKLYGEDDLLITSQVTEYLAIRDHQFLTYSSPDYEIEKLYQETHLQDEVMRATYQTLDENERHLKHQDFFASLPEDEQSKIQSDNRKKFCELVELISILTRRTRSTQQTLVRELQQLRRQEHAPNNQHAFGYWINEEKGQAIYLATGDLTELDGEPIDVIVNSENDYMQLARMFEINTLSVTLRIKGAYFVNGRLMDDRIQDELSAQVKATYMQQGLPVMLGEVIVTHAGHKQSRLVAEQGFRYIFHAATIHFDATFSDELLTPVNSKRGIATIVYNCLDKVEQINKRKGRIFPDGSPYAETHDETDYQDIDSIIFPIFGTGQAGRPVDEVIDMLLPAIRDWFGLHPDTSLKRVYISVYVANHVDIVQSEMQYFFPNEITAK